MPNYLTGAGPVPAIARALADVIHAAPHDGSGRMPCCGAHLVITDLSERITLDHDRVTCHGPEYRP